MAGIGFELRRLYRQDSLAGLAKAYFNSAMAATGPWLFTVLTLGGIALSVGHMAEFATMTEFRSIVIYNFCFSLVFASPIFMIVTRFVSDAIYGRDVSFVPGALIGSMILFCAVSLPIVSAFYFGYASINTSLACVAVFNFLLTGMVWLACVFLSALKDYQTITWAFLAGMVTAAGAATGLSGSYGATGMLSGFSIGIAVIMAMLVARIYAEYPYPLKQPFAFMRYFRTHWELAAGGLLYNSAIWVDKWIMWFSPQSRTLPSGLIMYPNYDSAMFLAYLSIIPALSIFLFNIETNFFEHYLRFYRDIQNKATYKQIMRNQHTMLAGIRGHSIHLFFLQFCICAISILAAPKIIALVHGNYLQIGIFRFGLLGALFHVMVLFLLILLSYFDNRKQALIIYAFFLTSNAAFTATSIAFGFNYYGYGYFLACFFTFVLAAFFTIEHVRRLLFHTFITSNASLQ